MPKKDQRMGVPRGVQDSHVREARRVCDYAESRGANRDGLSAEILTVLAAAFREGVRQAYGPDGKTLFLLARREASVTYSHRPEPYEDEATRREFMHLLVSEDAVASRAEPAYVPVDGPIGDGDLRRPIGVAGQTRHADCGGVVNEGTCERCGECPPTRSLRTEVVLGKPRPFASFEISLHKCDACGLCFEGPITVCRKCNPREYGDQIRSMENVAIEVRPFAIVPWRGRGGGVLMRGAYGDVYMASDMHWFIADEGQGRKHEEVVSDAMKLREERKELLVENAELRRRLERLEGKAKR